jgi:transposase InsO family protein
MAWRVAKVEEHRKEFIEKVQAGGRVATLCNEYQISRKTGYKWINRYSELGDEGLKDKSRCPHSQPGKTDDGLVQKILEIKHRYPSWGPKKVLALLEAHHPEEDWPSDTTVGNILQKNGLVMPRKYRKRIPAKTDPLAHCNAPNDVWSVDFKGWCMTRDQKKCEPLTVIDAYARFILYCAKLHSGKEQDVWKVCEQLFYENGLPKHLRHDNGPPFATTGAGRLSALSVKLIKVGVIPEWIDPGKPYQNGRHERMHRTLNEEGMFPLELTLDEQQMKFMDFIRYYNYERPHEALGQKIPGSVYVRSDRSWDGKLRSPEYGSCYLVKHVRDRGQMSWNGVDIYIGKTLRNEFVGLMEDEKGDWVVYYGPVFLGTIDHTGNFATPFETRRPKRAYKTRCY